VTIQDIAFTIDALTAAYVSGTTPEDVVAEVYRRIEMADDPALFLHLPEREVALAAARQLGAYDQAKPLWGIPFVVKDNIDVAGMPTTAACPEFAYLADNDAFVVDQLKQAGAIPIGKTNLDQFATGLVGVRSPYGVPKNAIDPEIVPGGSSSGSAVAVARGLVSFGLGTDTAGSGRVPAALNNIVGLKPSLGTLSASGMVPACRTLDTISVFALTVEDAFAAFKSATVYDPGDAYSKRFATPVLQQPSAGLKVGVPDHATRQFFGDAVQEASFDQAIETLRARGAEVVEVDFSVLYDIANMLYEGAWVAERYAAIEGLMRDNTDELHPTTRHNIGAAEELSAADAFKGIYKLADLKRQSESLLGGLDMLCVPTIPTFYTCSDLEEDPIGPNSRFGTYTNFVNLLDMCGIAVPMAPRSDGRPGSVTLLAPSGKDGAVAALAAQLHQNAGVTMGATGQALAVPASAKPLVADDEIAVAMVGAHMTGLPLNKEVKNVGGRFLFAGETAAKYRFYALAGGPPKRPGLVRQEDQGAAIAVEVWALPRAGFGAFMAGIPQPLGIGTVELSDGAMVKGFLCESAGLTGAEEITGFGGWRNYIASLG
jgi:allophanate hydrolase